MRAGEEKGRKKREGERLVLSRKNILWNSPDEVLQHRQGGEPSQGGLGEFLDALRWKPYWTVGCLQEEPWQNSVPRDW